MFASTKHIAGQALKRLHTTHRAPAELRFAPRASDEELQRFENDINPDNPAGTDGEPHLLRRRSSGAPPEILRGPNRLELSFLPLTVQLAIWQNSGFDVVLSRYSLIGRDIPLLRCLGCAP